MDLMSPNASGPKRPCGKANCGRGRWWTTYPSASGLRTHRGRILYGNAAGQQIWQGARDVGPEEFHEFKAWWADTGFPLGPDDWAVARAVRKGEPSLNEILEIECFDGTRKTVNNSAVPLRVGDGRIFGVVVLNEDITQRENF